MNRIEELMEEFQELVQDDNRREDALPVIQEVVSLAKEQYGESSRQYAMMLNNLGGWYGFIGELEKSEEQLIRALEILEIKNDTQPQDLHKLIINLVEVSERLGKTDQAKEFQTKADFLGKL